MSGIAGPLGDGDYCEYTLGWSTRLAVAVGDTLRCGIEGTAHDDNDAVPYSEFTYDVVESNAPLADKIGAGNSETEYWMFYSLAFPDP